MTSASYSISEDGAFILSKENLEALVKISEEFTSSGSEISVKFDDGFTFEFASGSEMLSSDFFRTSLAEKIEIKSGEKVGNDVHVIMLNLESWLGNGRVSARLSGDPSYVSKAKLGIEKEIRNAKAGYNWIYNVKDFVWFICFLPIFSTIFAFPVVDYIIGAENINDQSGEFSLRVNALSTGVPLGLVALFLCSKIKIYVAPPFIVKIGRGGELADGKKDTRKRALWLIIGLIVTGFIGNLLR